MKNIKLDSRGAAPCKHCMRTSKVTIYPNIVEINGEELFYAQCPKCKHWDIYDFLGSSEKNSIKVWNTTMLVKKE